MVLRRQKSHALCSGRTDDRLSLKSLNWLPIQKRIAYKLAVLSFKTRTSSTPLYLSDFYILQQLHLVYRGLSTPSATTSSTNGHILGRCDFSVAAQTVWSSLAQLRLGGFLPTFKKHVKSSLFTSAF